MLKPSKIIVILLSTLMLSLTAPTLAQSGSQNEQSKIYEAIYAQDFELAEKLIEELIEQGVSSDQLALYEGMMSSMEWTSRYDYNLASAQLNKALSAGIPNSGVFLASLYSRQGDICQEAEKFNTDLRDLASSLEKNLSKESSAFWLLSIVLIECIGEEFSHPDTAKAIELASSNGYPFAATLAFVKALQTAPAGTDHLDILASHLAGLMEDANFGLPNTQRLLGKMLFQFDESDMKNYGFRQLYSSVLSGETSLEDFRSIVGNYRPANGKEELRTWILIRAAEENLKYGFSFERNGCPTSHKNFVYCVANAAMDYLHCWQPGYVGNDSSPGVKLADNAAYQACRRHRLTSLLN